VTETATVARVLAALAYGERLASERAAKVAILAPDARGRQHQETVAARESENAALLEFRLSEIGSAVMALAFKPFFDAFFAGTEPSDWLEAQAFHYVGDAMVADFADVLMPAVDPVSAVLLRRALADREDEEAFALDELTRGIEADPSARDRVAAYSRRVIGEALTQTRKALNETGALSELLGGPEVEKRLLLEILERHRRRLDRLGIEPVEDPLD
jgi:hypothetical protein